MNCSNQFPWDKVTTIKIFIIFMFLNHFSLYQLYADFDCVVANVSFIFFFCLPKAWICTILLFLIYFVSDWFKTDENKKVLIIYFTCLFSIPFFVSLFFGEYKKFSDNRISKEMEQRQQKIKEKGVINPKIYYKDMFCYSWNIVVDIKMNCRIIIRQW